MGENSPRYPRSSECVCFFLGMFSIVFSSSDCLGQGFTWGACKEGRRTQTGARERLASGGVTHTATPGCPHPCCLAHIVVYSDNDVIQKQRAFLLVGLMITQNAQV